MQHARNRCPAVFLDRDGTIVEQVHYLSDPADVRLIEGAPEAISGFREAGFRVIVVTNQSAIGRGRITTSDYEAVNAEMNAQLGAAGARVDAIYHCPIAPTSSDRTTIDHPDRKPGPGMLLRAADDFDLDLARSWMVGDMLSDTIAGRNAGVSATVLVRTGLAAESDGAHPSVDHHASGIGEAARLILAGVIRTGRDENREDGRR